MPELETQKQLAPEENQPGEPPLTAKKKRAMLEYMGIMFAVAFLFVAISLFIKLLDVQGELDNATAGARENIERLQQNLDEEKAKNDTLQGELDDASNALTEAQDALQQANTSASEAAAKRDEVQTQFEQASQQVVDLGRELQAAELLRLAQEAYYAKDGALFAQRMKELEPFADALSESGAQRYAELQKEEV